MEPIENVEIVEQSPFEHMSISQAMKHVDAILQRNVANGVEESEELNTIRRWLDANEINGSEEWEHYMRMLNLNHGSEISEKFRAVKNIKLRHMLEAMDRRQCYLYWYNINDERMPWVLELRRACNVMDDDIV